MRELFELMARQHGVVSTEQARHLGVSPDVQRRLLRDGVLILPHPSVVALAGIPTTFAARAMAATFAPGVWAVSHGAAARLHRLDGFEQHLSLDVMKERGLRSP